MHTHAYHVFVTVINFLSSILGWQKRNLGLNAEKKKIHSPDRWPKEVVLASFLGWAPVPFDAGYEHLSRQSETKEGFAVRGFVFFFSVGTEIVNGRSCLA